MHSLLLLNYSEHFQRLTVAGLLITLLLVCGLARAQAPPGITVAGGTGRGDVPNQLTYPSGLFIDGSGNLFVADKGNYRIQKFPPNSTSATAGITVAGGNGNGNAANQLEPSGVSVNGSGIFVADSYNNRIQKFPLNSTSATSGSTVAGGSQGSGATQLDYPFGLFVNGSGNLFVADFNNHRVQKFGPNSTSATSGTTVAGSTEGSGPTQLDYPFGVFVDGSGNIFVADYINNRIQKFPPNSTSATSGTTVAGGNGFGSAANQLSSPSGVFVDGLGNVFVADQGNHRIQKFPANSTSTTPGVTVAGGNGNGDAANQLDEPSGVVVDASGAIYVADFNNHRIQKFVLNTFSITGQPPSSAVVCTGSSVVASVNASGTGPFTYQWYKDNISVAGQTTATLSLTNVQPTAAGNYRVVVTAGVSSLTSSTFNLTVNALSPDKALLTELYNATGGPNWIDKTNWLSGCNPCDWFGITCDGNARVTGINLYQNNLIGTLPASMSGLTQLQDLELYENQLTGPIPAGIGALTSLTIIALNDNLFSGSIPASLSALVNLTLLDLSTNQLSGSIPIGLGALTNLTYFSLSENQLSGSIPASLGKLTNVEYLDLYVNQLSGTIPSSLGMLTRLRNLTLFNNQLSGSIPASLGALPNLVNLFLYNNQLSGCWPTSFSALCGVSVYADSNPGLPGGGDFDAFCSAGSGSCPPPDLSPILYVLPSTHYGISAMTIVVDVFELNGASTAGLITVMLSKDHMVNLTLDKNLTNVAGRTVQNGIWTIDGSDENYYVLSTTQSVDAGNKLSFGLKGMLNPMGTSGVITCSVTIAAGSGGEIRITNNMDSDKIDYFKK